MTLTEQMTLLGKQARAASRDLARFTTAQKNDCLLAMADAMVFPSQYEGFGAPLIEAMALGAPVICSDATCMPQIVGTAGLVRPLTTAAWAGALGEVRTRRAELIAAGHLRARDFTSAVSGAALADIYEKALSNG